MQQKSLLNFFKKSATVANSVSNTSSEPTATADTAVTDKAESKSTAKQSKLKPVAVVVDDKAEDVDLLKQQFREEVAKIDIEARGRMAETDDRPIVPDERRRKSSLSAAVTLFDDDNDAVAHNEGDDDDNDDDDDDGSEDAAKTKGKARKGPTPLEQQYTTLRDKHKGVVLAIECGYKYQFFGDDALIANQLLKIAAFTKKHANIATAMVPTNRVMFHLRRLVIAGFKVARVIQTETAALKKASAKRGTFDRGVDRIFTRATFVGSDDIDPLEVRDDDAPTGGFLMCIVERPARARAVSADRGDVGVVASTADNSMRVDQSRDDTRNVMINILAANVATGEVVFDGFEDDALRGALEARLSLIEPVEILFSFDALSASTRAVIAHWSGAKCADASVGVSKVAQAGGRARLESLPMAFVNTDTAQATVAKIFSTPDDSSKRKKRSSNNNDADDDDGDGVRVETTTEQTTLSQLTVLPGLSLACVAAVHRHLQSLGGRLERCLTVVENYRDFNESTAMRLDAGAIRNLSLFADASALGETRGTLFAHINRTRTSAGSRVLRRWLTSPLRSTAHIVARQDAVALLRPNTDRVACIQPLIKFLHSMPDLERGLTRIYNQTWDLMRSCLSLGERVSCRCSAAEFVKLLTAFDKLANLLPSSDIVKLQFGTSPLLTRLFDGNVASDSDAASALATVKSRVNALLSALDTKAALAGDVRQLFAPTCSLYPDVNTLVTDMNGIVRALEETHLQAMRREMSMPSLSFVSVSGNEYIVEVPVSAKSRVPSGWKLVMATTKVVRYRSAAVVSAYEELQRVRERLQIAAQAAWLDYLKRSAADYAPLRALVAAVANLDALLALAAVAALPNYCRPSIVDYVNAADAPLLDASEARHPVLETLVGDTATYVPNDVAIGDADEMSSTRRRALVITGANMGGKSSYVRQVAALAILAQIGSFVPARSMRLRAFDAVYVRMGAADALAAGQSTFYVELSETACLLRGATRRSLLLLDELGRGTSTVDGTAVAYATLAHIATRLRSVCLFVTHYPTIGQLAELHPNDVACYYMAYREEAPLADDVALVPRITFLYNLRTGIAPASFGLNVARVAGLPPTILVSAVQMAAELEQRAVVSEFSALVARVQQ